MRDLYAIVQFYTTHPDHPLPWAITMHHSVGSVGQVDELAIRYGLKPYGDPDANYQLDQDIPGTSIPVQLVVNHNAHSRRPL